MIPGFSALLCGGDTLWIIAVTMGFFFFLFRTGLDDGALQEYREPYAEDLTDGI